MSVLRLWASHLFLIRTNLGYGTVLTTASARQGCSATDYYVIPKNLFKSDGKIWLQAVFCGKKF
jgi:hypothetical protein